ncbi:methyl-accepting chemotaxis protein [Clostridiaceae bacterium UIB06]|uniref:Methyl-accepting chemotaxis protein n=1 Tax=Clostridium thailandense TaxID=2794346 RepID=A0A949WUB9_9CLOT|nr:methyl-accepting chemotaxis protein [Clostridium thailandense]MBV7272422.1 methyl-accepting chemotaxis protein [Clostridium thailandense]MCH5136946.1 methyl-accepting chemotaxis protein [Clostridiaceae bacterium UIB06]
MIKLKFINGLRTKLIICFLVISIIPALIIAGLSYNNSRKFLQQDAIQRLSFVRDTKKKEVEDYLNSGLNRVSYMAQEPMAIDAMNELSQIQDIQNSNYNNIYQKYNPAFVGFVNKLEAGDILLVDSKTGNILYSTLKESDYGTNLLNGPYKNTNVAKAFENARNSSDKNFVCITDYEIYSPSNSKPIASIAAPIFKGNENIGVLIFKLGTNKIDEIVSNNNKWESLNIGESGEVVLIGSDYKARSNTRFLSSESDEKIKAAKSTILLKEIRTKGADEVLAGKTNVETYGDYHNTESIVAYTPLNIDSLKWGVLVKINQSEAYEPVNKLKIAMMFILIAAVAVIIIVSVGIASNIAKPMIKMSKVANEISMGDLNVDLPEVKRSDEIGILTNTISNMIHNLREQTKEIINVANVIASSVSQITASLTQVTSGATETSSAVSETTATVEEVKQTVYVSSEKTKNVSNSARQSLEISKAGDKATEETLEGMNSINFQMQAIAESIIVLSEQSQNISELIESVDNISEQSGILAVNASIEAAKAGDQGKGFSVVAQEIRNLAEQSKQGTKQVRNILKDIQKAASNAVMTTEKGIKLAEMGMKQASEAGNAIRKLTENINMSAQAAMQIEASSQQQLIGMDQIAIAMDGINEASVQNVDSMKQLEDAAKNLQDMGYRLKALTEKYQV